MKIIIPFRHQGLDALVIHLAGTVDILSQSRVKIAMRATFDDLLFVIEFDFGNQQTCGSARVIMRPSFFLIGNGNWQLSIVSPVTAASSDWRAHRFSNCWCGKGRRMDRFGVSRSKGGLPGNWFFDSEVSK